MIQLQNIRFGYTKNRNIFDDVSLTMEAGHIYGLLGKNGAGKTTLLKIMSGLRFPTSGTATILNQNAVLRKAEILQDIYFLQEEMYVPHMKIESFVKAYSPFYPRFNHEQFNEYLREFELDKEFGYLDKLSHGQKKKTLIAFALATNTQILIMDEPTNGLDIPSKSTFRRLMASAADETRLVIISTHQVRDLHSLIDMVAILDNGRMVLNASTYEITEKLLFDVDNTKTTEGTVLYTEESPRGAYQVKENVHHIDSNLDLELLFNAAMNNKNAIINLFK
ncbi:MAG: ABC transporter ATP-binding protein [Bacteroidales bacterium]|nr:ABC transporter ATP-binding protein [Bacteroidales bacterium]